MSLKPMTADEMGKMIINRDELFVLDVRNEEQYKEWRITGDSVTSMNKPYFDLIEGVDEILDDLPADKPILVACAKEGSSKFVADQIVEATGRDVFYLEGGMKSYSEDLQAVKLGDLSNGGALYQFVRLGKGCLSYIAVAKNGEAAIVDATRMTDQYLKFIEENNLTLKHAIDTHLHADHISGARTLREKTGAKYWLPSKDAEEVQFDYEAFEDGQEIQIGDEAITLNAVYSPGHTIGSTSVIIDNEYLITGDILFVKSIGRPDLAGKAEDWVGDLRHSLYVTYKNLDQNLKVLPAHFAHFEEVDEAGRVFEKLGVLFETNDGLLIPDEAEFREYVTGNLPPQPNAYQEIRQTNMGKIDPDPEEKTEMEIGPNRCAVTE
ncbi:MBL fold metallo-hydrolase [Salisediminibacterium halotolerans]|uniref:Glyoxylase, beta-lactamase superfamily II n=1 Tax=Salisediminibacterium halotolerans TaxID=517425 RepID=A0A1H9WDJ4_9BACI|nr:MULTISPECIES: MBL fold metallo-hydrolase [Salisediminibacterium]RLJ73210.1 glyoxylase-like metal-dependent hydrolase (beta-lactamase superfamily II) [Actinophytocola xinjiangensis]RPE86632.1 glyoxylase-like metal-dependent hydrolase (beta-lactamase superfamily II) [Salisediminibacterium halotolerans]TWG34007.1 glyoxylase-like metal-dependent hydrolase (beta-lactamase superfamily II) [Salisediminibacterium halotolerans]SES31851.1 Glyoxylase, beta-lactamase superfamily II [Salisediminibacteriu